MPYGKTSTVFVTSRSTRSTRPTRPGPSAVHQERAIILCFSLSEIQRCVTERSATVTTDNGDGDTTSTSSSTKRKSPLRTMRSEEPAPGLSTISCGNRCSRVCALATTLSLNSDTTTTGQSTRTGPAPATRRPRATEDNTTSSCSRTPPSSPSRRRESRRRYTLSEDISDDSSMRLVRKVPRLFSSRSHLERLTKRATPTRWTASLPPSRLGSRHWRKSSEHLSSTSTTSQHSNSKNTENIRRLTISLATKFTLLRLVQK